MLIISFVGVMCAYHPKYVLVDWHNVKAAPFEVSNSLEIGVDRHLLKRKSLSLVCHENKVRMLLRSNLELPSWADLKPAIPATLTVDTRHEIHVNATRIGKKIIDEVITEPLTSEQVNILIQSLNKDPKGLNKLTFSITETGTSLITSASAGTIQIFTLNCVH